MSQTLTVPLLGADGNTYYFVCDASGGSAVNIAGGGLVQLDGAMARYATILTSGTGPTTWLPDGTHQATRLVALINAGEAPQAVVLSLYDSISNATTNLFWTGTLPAGPPIVFNYPITNGLTWAVSATLAGGSPIVLLAN